MRKSHGRRCFGLTLIVLLAGAAAASAQNEQGVSCEQTFIRATKSVNAERAANQERLRNELKKCTDQHCKDEAVAIARGIDRELQKNQIDLQSKRDICKFEWFLDHEPPASPCDKQFREETARLNLDRMLSRAALHKELIDCDRDPLPRAFYFEAYKREGKREAGFGEDEKSRAKERDDCRSSQVLKK